MKVARFVPLFLFFVSCGRGPSVPQTAFYYWSTDYKISTADSTFLKESSCNKMYVRFFDVGYKYSWENQSGDIVPMGRLVNKRNFMPGVETVPVIFLEKEIFTGPKDTAQLRWLCSKITTKLFRMARNHGLPENRIKEIQLDCDWTDKTRENYFAFIDLFKKQCPHQKISATLRLYQYKYRTKAGVPPVDRCMLMYYNMSQIEEFSTKNYILDNEVGKKYIDGVEAYPLALDFGLPIYSQGVRYSNRDSAFYGIENMTMADTVGKKVVALHPKEGNILLKGDYNFTRFEFVTRKNLEEAARILSEAVNTDSFSVSFFHLDQSLYQPIGYETIKKVTGLIGHR